MEGNASRHVMITMLNILFAHVLLVPSVGRSDFRACLNGIFVFFSVPAKIAPIVPSKVYMATVGL